MIYSCLMVGRMRLFKNRLHIERFFMAMSVAGVLAGLPSVVLSQSSSTNYSVEESYIGPGGQNDANSSSYNLNASLGDTGIGNSASTNYQVYGGFTTTQEEYLEINVTAATVDFGIITDSATATGSAEFYVRSYLANGYAVTSSGAPPTNGTSGDQIEGKAVQGAPAIGTEEFGFNLKANTAPAAFGAEVEQIPDSSFSFGYAATGYDVADQYKYVEGETIAQADSSSGQTNYTLAYIINRAFMTPAGVYTMTHSIIATSTF